MTDPNTLQTILDRITAGTHTDDNLAALRRYLLVDSTRQVVQLGEYNVHIGQGQDIQIGDRIYQGVDAETLRRALRQILDEVHEVRLRPGIPFQVPPLPAHFVPRPEASDQIKARPGRG